jgi:hypothetical protein
MLGYRGAKQGLLDVHLLASKPTGKGSYSDAHVTFVLSNTEKQHIYYQVNGGRLVADYALAPHGWRSSYWLNFPALKDSAETELLHLVEYCRSEGTLDEVPRAND